MQSSIMPWLSWFLLSPWTGRRRAWNHAWPRMDIIWLLGKKNICFLHPLDSFRISCVCYSKFKCSERKLFCNAKRERAEKICSLHLSFFPRHFIPPQNDNINSARDVLPKGITVARRPCVLCMYKDSLNGLYVVGRSVFMLALNHSALFCPDHAQQDCIKPSSLPLYTGLG